MCWKNYKREEKVIKVNDEPICHIAEADILTYKIIQHHYGRLYAYFQRMPYEVSKVYSLEDFGEKLIVSHTMDNTPYIKEGFHTYTDDNYLMFDCMGNVDVNYMFDAIQHYIASDGNAAVAQCVIPKGSKYYVNDRGEVVSDRIIIKNYGNLSYLIREKANQITRFHDIPMKLSERKKK